MSGNFFMRHARVPESITIHRLFNAGTRTRVGFTRDVLKNAALAGSMAKYWGQNSEHQRESLVVTIDKKTTHVPEKSHASVLTADHFKELAASCALDAWHKFNDYDLNPRVRLDDDFMKLDQIIARAIGGTPPGFYLVRTENYDLTDYASQRKKLLSKQLRIDVPSEDNWVAAMQEYLSMLVFAGIFPNVDVHDQSEYDLTANGIFPLKASLKFVGAIEELKKIIPWFTRHEIKFEPIPPQVRQIAIHFTSGFSGEHNPRYGLLHMGDAVGELPALRISDHGVHKLRSLVIRDIQVSELYADKTKKTKLIPS